MKYFKGTSKNCLLSMEIGIRYKRYKVCEQAYTSIPYTFLNFVWLKISDF